MDLMGALYWIGAIFISIGSTSGIVILLAKWFGDRLANKLLEKDKAKYQNELEELKIRYQEELEIKKNDLEKSKSVFLRYSEHQFNLYNDLWKSLCDLRHIGEELWDRAETQKVTEFSKQLKVTKLTVEKSALLIEDKHYKELIRILDDFGRFRIGKMTLISLRSKREKDLINFGVDDDEIKRVIDDNENSKQQFVTMVDELATIFKKQIKGE